MAATGLSNEITVKPRLSTPCNHNEGSTQNQCLLSSTSMFVLVHITQEKTIPSSDD